MKASSISTSQLLHLIENFHSAPPVSELYALVLRGAQAELEEREVGSVADLKEQVKQAESEIEQLEENAESIEFYENRNAKLRNENAGLKEKIEKLEAKP